MTSSQGARPEEWLVLWATFEGNVRGMQAFNHALQRFAADLSADRAWSDWWAGTQLPPLDVDLHLGTSGTFKQGDITFRRSKNVIRVRLYSLSGPAEIGTQNPNVVISRDLDHLLEACVARFKIQAPRPADSRVPSGGREAELAPDAMVEEPSDDRLVVEIHVPVTASASEASPPGDPWLDELDRAVYALEDEGEFVALDDGESAGDEYLFFIMGRSEAELLASAARLVRRPGVPAGAYAVITTADSPGFGVGRRVDL